MKLIVNPRMIDAGLDVLEERLAWEDYPYTNRQLVEAILREAVKHYEPPPPKKTRRDPAAGYVYFVGNGEHIKIGKANDPEARLGELQVGHSRPLVLLAVEKGGLRRERRLHHDFAHLRVAGEWFKDCKEIRDYIDSLGCAPDVQTHRKAA